MNAIVPSVAGDDHIGLAVVRSLGRSNIPTTVVSNKKGSISFYSKYCTTKRVTEYNDEFFSGLTDDDLILPTRDDEMLLFAKNAPRYDYSLAFPRYEELNAVIDKSQLMRYAIQHRLPVPATFFVDERTHIQDISDSLPYPVIIKPNRGTGGRGIIQVKSPDKLAEIYATHRQQFGPSMIQESIPFKTRYSAAALINQNREIQRICVIQEKRTYPLHTGPGCFVETVANDEIVDLTCTILKDLNIWGVAELDFVIDERDGKPRFLEINPRFWGSVQCAVTAGVDFPFLLYEIAIGNPIGVSYDYRQGITARNVLFDDLRHLLAVLRGGYPFRYKLKMAFDFFKFYNDDVYYIYSISDLKPFLSLFQHYFFKVTYQKYLQKCTTTSK